MSYASPSYGTLWRYPHALTTLTEGAAGMAFLSCFSAASGTWPAQNRAIYVPVLVKKAGVVTGLASMNGATVSGNIDIGIYTATGTRVVSTGSTAMSGQNGEQVIDITDTSIDPGLYYLAMAVDNTTAAFYRQAPAAPMVTAMGVLTQESAFVLPATATYALTQAGIFHPGIAMLFDPTVT